MILIIIMVLMVFFVWSIRHFQLISRFSQKIISPWIGTESMFVWGRNVRTSYSTILMMSLLTSGFIALWSCNIDITTVMWKVLSVIYSRNHNIFFNVPCIHKRRLGGMCLWHAWVCCMNLTKNSKEWEIRHTQTYRHKTWNRKVGMGGLHVSDGKCECPPEPEYLFYRSVQGKDSRKNQALTILWYKVKGMRFGGLIFLRL
jgi:hypothetical protein